MRDCQINGPLEAALHIRGRTIAATLQGTTTLTTYHVVLLIILQNIGSFSPANMAYGMVGLAHCWAFEVGGFIPV